MNGKGLGALAVLATLCVGWACAQEPYSTQRRNLLEEIRQYGPPAIDERVLTAMDRVPRHEFVPDSQRPAAYLNRPLPIGAGQTISQPYIVALMTDLADVDAQSVVLEVGTGSGYQAAVLAELAGHVYTIEIIDLLAERATVTLKRLGYDNVTVRAGDGYAGWPEHAPFDAIVVTAAPDEVPAPLIEQLAIGGKLVIPVGPVNEVQILKVLSKDENGEIETRNVSAVRFVPFTRKKE